jgi:hypothetical protein
LPECLLVVKTLPDFKNTATTCMVYNLHTESHLGILKAHWLFLTHRIIGESQCAFEIRSRKAN